MRILSCIATANPAAGGPIDGIMRFSEQVARLGVVQEIVSLDHADDPWVASAPLTVHAIGRRRGGGGPLRRLADHYRYAPGYLAWLRANLSRYDVALVHGLWNYSVSGASRVLPTHGIPYFVFAHGMMDPWFRRRYPIKHVGKQLTWLVAEGRLAARAQSLLFTCESERLLARGVFRGHHYRETVVSYGAAEPPPIIANDADLIATALPTLGDAPYLLFLSRIHEKKGCDLLIEAFARAVPSTSPLRLVIAGPDATGLQPRLEQLARARGVADRVIFPGPLYGDAKWAALRGAEAFVLPSHQENFGIAVAEALGCGTPVLISDQVNIWHEVVEGGGGLAAPDTIDGATNLLRRWLALDAKDRTVMRAAARQTFDARFNIRNTAPQLLAVLGGASVNG